MLTGTYRNCCINKIDLEVLDVFNSENDNGILLFAQDGIFLFAQNGISLFAQDGILLFVQAQTPSSSRLLSKIQTGLSTMRSPRGGRIAKGTSPRVGGKPDPKVKIVLFTNFLPFHAV